MSKAARDKHPINHQIHAGNRTFIIRPYGIGYRRRRDFTVNVFCFGRLVIT